MLPKLALPTDTFLKYSLLLGLILSLTFGLVGTTVAQGANKLPASGERIQVEKGPHKKAGKRLRAEKRTKKKRYSKKLAKKIVDDAERLRAFKKASSKVKVETLDDGKSTTYFMDVLQSTERRAYLEFTAPAEEVGRRMLAIKTNYWSKFPDSKRVISISRREAIGNSAFAIADVFQMDTVGDYDPKVIGEETIDKDECYLVELNAKHDDAPYFKIVYTVRKSDHYPIVAKFYGASGKHIKTMSVEKSAKIAGMVRPKVLLMTDLVTKGKQSTWTTIKVKRTSIPDNVFTKAYLKSR